MDNNENLSNELLKQDGISPVGISDTERAKFKAMLEAERKRVKRLALIVQIPLWIFTISLLLLCVSERLLEALHIPFIAAWAVLMLVAWIILFPLAFRFLARLKSTRVRLRRLQKLMPGYIDKRKRTSIVIVGVKDGKRIIKWPAVISLGIVVWSITGLVSTGIYYLLARCWSPFLIMYSGLMSMVFVAACVYQGLKTPIEELTKLKSTQPNILRTITKRRITKIAAAAAAVIIVGIGLLVYFGPAEKVDTTIDSEVSKSPVEMMTAISLELAFRQGGIEAVEDQCRKAFSSLGLRPGSLSFEQIFQEFNSNNKSSEGTRP